MLDVQCLWNVAPEIAGSEKANAVRVKQFTTSIQIDAAD